MNLLKSALAVMIGLSSAGAPVYAQTEKNIMMTLSILLLMHLRLNYEIALQEAKYLAVVVRVF